MQSARRCWVRTDPFGPPDSQKSRWMHISHVSSGHHCPKPKSTNIPRSGRHLLLAYRGWKPLIHFRRLNLLEKTSASRPFAPEHAGWVRTFALEGTQHAVHVHALHRLHGCGCCCVPGSGQWRRRMEERNELDVESQSRYYGWRVAAQFDIACVD
jgi:hypothetical protein